MRISSIQQGLCVHYDFAKYVTIGSGGRAVVLPPMTDDERRDSEIVIDGRRDAVLSFQEKSAMQLTRLSKNARYLMILFDVRPERLVNSPYFWYFLAYLNPKSMRVADPTFVVPSKVFHELAAPRMRKGVWQFTMAASMEPLTRDKWHPYRVATLDLGQRILEIAQTLH